MRDELINETLFFSLDQARNVIAAWVEDYNTIRPHSALGYRPPAPERIIPMDQKSLAPTLDLTGLF